VQFDLALQKGFQLTEGTKIVIGVEGYNLFNHPNFAVPSNTQSPLTLGGTETLFLRTQRVISPTMSAEYLVRSAPRVSFS
jgi:hypothetical protein